MRQYINGDLDCDYSVTEDGRVFSHSSNKYMKNHVKENGYIWVGLKRKGKSSTHFVHRVVALTYIPNPENLPCVNHINGDKANNHVSNLEWCSYKQNTKHMLDNSMSNTSRKGIKPLTDDEVKYVYTEVKSGRKTITAVAKEIDRHRTVVSSIINKKSRRSITDKLD